MQERIQTDDLLLIPEDSLQNYVGLKADVVITDPPYGTTACRWDSPIDLPSFWRLVQSVSNGFCVSFAQTPFDKVLGCSNLPNLRYEWIWEKSTATGHLNANRMPMKGHENILVFYNNLPPYYPQKIKADKIRKNRGRIIENMGEVYGKYPNKPAWEGTEHYPRSVVFFASENKASHSFFHPTQKPLALLEYLVLTYTKAADTVCDPFMGSGTTGVACRKLGRKFIGFENDPEIFSKAAERILGTERLKLEVAA